MINVIFDWSGVIKDAFKSHCWVVNRIFSKYGLSNFSLDELREKWEEPYMVFYNRYLPDITMEEVNSDYRREMSDSSYPISEPFPKMVGLIKDLKSKGNYLAVITSDLPESFIPEMEKFGLNNIFDNVVTNVHEKADDLRKLINNNRLDPKSTFIVGDSNNEILAGKGLGVKSIAVTWGFTTEQKLLEGKPSFTVHSVDELTEIIG